VSSRVRPVAVAATVALLVAFLPATPASAVGSPTLTITTPPAGPVSGQVTVSVDGTTDGAGTAGAVEVYADTGSGPHAIGAVACPGTGTAPSGCTGYVVWDSTSVVNGAVSLSASLFDSSAPSVPVVSTLASTAVTVSNPSASVAITPPSGAVSGSAFGVTVSGAANSGAVPTSVDVMAGATVLGSQLCPASPTPADSCALTVPIDTSLLPQGSVNLTATLFVGTAPVATSSPLPVTVDNPAPTVQISAPSASATLFGLTTVAASALTDASLTDYPTSILVSDNGAPIGTVPCTPPARACSGALPWDVTSLSGSHTVTAQVSTHGSKTATATVLVTVSNPLPTVVISVPAGPTVFGLTTVNVSASTGSTLTDYPASINVSDEKGVFATVTCDVSKHTCPGSVQWDATGPSGPRTLTALVTTVGGAIATAAVDVTVANPDPAVSITSPADGASVVGATSVAVSASTGSTLSDFPASIAVTADGSRIGTVPCAPLQHVCGGSVAWDATALSGAHSLSAVLTTTDGLSATASSSVTVANPAPTVGITSPGTSAVVSGSVTVLVSGSTDPRRSDLPSTFTLLVDGIAVSSVVCPSATHDCSVALSWSAAASAGPHTLVTTMTTTGGSSATSAAVVVLAASPSRVVMTLPKIGRAGATVVVTGRVVAETTGQGVAGAVVTLTRRPAVGKASTVWVLTGPGGVFTSRSVARTNTGVTAVVASSAWLGSSRGATVLRAAAPMTCTVARHRLVVGAVGRGSCAVPGLPAGTRLALRYLVRGRLATLASGSARGSAIPYSFGFPTPGVYLLRIDLLATKVYVATSSSLIRVVVR